MIQKPASPNQDRYHRQTLFAPLGRDGQEKLRAAAVLIVGCGALGSNIAEQLARAGVGRIRLVDRDIVEPSNLHRQVVYTELDAREGRAKAVALAERLREVNSEIALESLVEDFNHTTARELARGVQLLIDGSDNLPARFLMNDLALELRVPWIYGGAVGEDARAQLFAPDIGPCLRCTLPELPPAGSLPTCDTSGVLGAAASAAASFQSALALRVLSRPESVPELAGRLIRMTLWSPTASVADVARDPSCPACAGGRRDFLGGYGAERTTVLCGRNAVQLLPASRGAARVDLEALAARLEGSGSVDRTAFLLRFSPQEETAAGRLTVFADGRAIVEGTKDAVSARALYDRYVGQ